MFETVVASRFVRPMDAGRTKPMFIECEDDSGSCVELIVKCSSRTMQGVHDLAVEAICGMLARDLELPVPGFFAVRLTPEFIGTLQDEEIRASYVRSDAYAFGSQVLPTGYTAWPIGETVPRNLCRDAAEIYAFDAIVVNGDRRPDNPNCLFSGTKLAIIDHELCFAHELFWKAPWLKDGFATRSSPEQHIFAKPRLESCPPELDSFEARWRKIDDARIDAYFNALPPSWKLDCAEGSRIRSIILDSRDHIDQVVQRALEALR